MKPEEYYLHGLLRKGGPTTLSLALMMPLIVALMLLCFAMLVILFTGGRP